VPNFGLRQKQRKAVFEAMKHDKLMTLVQAAYHTGVPEPNVWAQLRQLDNGHSIPHEIVRKEGLNWYRLIV
jgi:hypothetical protein